MDLGGKFEAAVYQHLSLFLTRKSHNLQEQYTDEDKDVNHL
jgi:hypothetical protein